MKFLHAMIRVKKVDEAINFYCNLLGLKEDRKIRLEDCYLLYLKDERTGFEIELTVNDCIPKTGYSNGDAFGHFAFEVDDMEIITKKMHNLGYEFEIEPFYMPEVKTRICFLLDPDGNQIELIEKR